MDGDVSVMIPWTTECYLILSSFWIILNAIQMKIEIMYQMICA